MTGIRRNVSFCLVEIWARNGNFGAIHIFELARRVVPIGGEDDDHDGLPTELLEHE